MLVGTTSVESSERLSNRLARRAGPAPAAGRPGAPCLHAGRPTGRRMAGSSRSCSPSMSRLESITADALRKFAAGFGLNSISLDEASQSGARCWSSCGCPRSLPPRLKTVMQAGVPHQVLNARRHTEESQIIAGAGAFGAVTIATNMAGRGVDIKLGGELAEEIITAVNRVLRRAGYADAFDMPIEERRQALLKVDPGQYGVYEGRSSTSSSTSRTWSASRRWVACTSSARNVMKPAASTTNCAAALPARVIRAPRASTSPWKMTSCASSVGSRSVASCSASRWTIPCPWKPASSAASSRTRSTGWKAPTSMSASTCLSTTTCSTSSASRSTRSATASSPSRTSPKTSTRCSRPRSRPGSRPAWWMKKARGN